MTDNSNGNATPTNKPPQPAPLKITSAREFRRLRREGQLVELPSGMVARLRPVALIDLWRTAGNIPDALTSIIAELVANQSLNPEKSEMTGQLIGAVGDLYGMVCRAAFITPAIVEAPRDEAEEIQLEDVTQADRQFVLAWASAPTNELGRFHHSEGGQESPLGSVEPSDGVRAATKPTP